jgi:hypothetical protein
MKPNLTWRSGIATVVLVALLASVGVAYAAIPSADGVIHACYNATSNPAGMLRVIDAEAGAKCAKNEKPLNFNQTGPQGPAGPAGPQGIPGKNGNTILSGTTAPTAALGVLDDFYLDTAALQLYGPKTNAECGCIAQGRKGRSGNRVEPFSRSVQTTYSGLV